LGVAILLHVSPFVHRVQ